MEHIPSTIYDYNNSACKLKLFIINICMSTSIVIISQNYHTIARIITILHLHNDTYTTLCTITVLFKAFTFYLMLTLKHIVPCHKYTLTRQKGDHANFFVIEKVDRNRQRAINHVYLHLYT